jgi:hypothetical protein
LIPDFATIRDRATAASNPFAEAIYGIMSFGWSGNARAWHRFEEISLVLAGIATPLGTFGSHHCIHGLCNFGNSGLAHYHLPSLLSLLELSFSGFAMVQTLMLGDA